MTHPGLASQSRNTTPVPAEAYSIHRSIRQPRRWHSDILFSQNFFVLFFYPKDDTSGCTKESIAFDALRNRFEAAGASVLGLSADSIASHQRFKAKHGLSLPLASDTDKQMLRRFGGWTKKRMYGREYEGIERTTVLIDQQGRIARIWRKVKVPGHAEDVLHAVEIS